MKVAVTKLPANAWWGNGIISYEDNPAMQNGKIPDQNILKSERNDLIETIHKNNIEVVEFSFPKIFENSTYGHDYVFIRDAFISDLNGKALLLKFSQKNRESESSIVAEELEKLNFKIQELPSKKNMFAEGGEFYFCPKDNILFSGISRNSKNGAEEVASFLNVNDLIIIETNAFHLDTVFSTVLDKSGHLCAIIIAEDLISKQSIIELKKYAKSMNIKVLNAPIYDAFGNNGKNASFAINSFSSAGLIISSNKFSDHQIEYELESMDVKHEVVPVSQFQLSGGSIHCLTNEL